MSTETEARKEIAAEFSRFSEADEFRESLRSDWIDNAACLLQDFAGREPGNRSIPYYAAELHFAAGEPLRALVSLRAIDDSVPFAWYLDLLVRVWSAIHADGLVIGALLPLVEGAPERVPEGIAADCCAALVRRERRDDVRRAILPLLALHPDWRGLRLLLAVRASDRLPGEGILPPAEALRLLDEAGDVPEELAPRISACRDLLAASARGEAVPAPESPSGRGGDGAASPSGGAPASAPGSTPPHLQLLAELERNPRNAVALTALGCLADRAGLLAEGEDLHRRAIEVDPGCAAAWNNLGWWEANRGNSAEAVRLWERAVELDPAHVQALNSLGVHRDNEGDFEGGLRLFLRSDAIEPNRGPTLANLGYVLRKLGRLDEARGYIERAIVAEPGRAAHLLLLCDLYLDMDCPAEGLRCLERAAGLLDGPPMAFLTRLGRCFLRTGERVELERVLEKVRETRPSNPLELLELAELMERIDPEVALRCVEVYLEHPGPTRVKHEEERGRALRSRLLPPAH